MHDGSDRWGPSGSRLPPRLGARFAVVAGVAALACGAGLLATVAVHRPAPAPPILGRVPDFALVASTDAPFTRAHVAGRVWVADFFFTTCPGVCPRLSAQMARLQKELARKRLNDVRLVSFSVDPRNDTPAALREYARRFRADPARWAFVTGTREGLYTLIRDGFHLPVTEAADQGTPGGEIIAHSERFVLVDGEGRIRGYYSVLEEAAFRQLLRDASTLASAASHSGN
jgi:protein SCO1/2